MLNILDAVSRGQASLEDLDQLESLADHIKKGSLCGLGQTAPNPVLSTLRHFREEYEEHIALKTCRAAVCDGLIRSPCQHACPAGVNVPEYLALAAEGRLTEAANIIRRRNPFVSVCGRVCDHPCERRCRRSEIDQPLAIRALKRYIADYMDDYDTPMARSPQGRAEVAIVGSGPAGLSCAYFLALMQRPSVVFEAQPIPGGMLSLGIPEFRLPKDILNKEIGFILSHGVQLKTEERIENAMDLLKAGFKAVFVATGGHRGKLIHIEGSDFNGVVDALEFLRDRALGKGMDCNGKRILVLGGGNAAVDVARSAVRLGAKEVTILYRRTRNEMPAYEEEIEGALEEDVKLVTLGIPKRIIGKGQTLSAIEFLKAELGEADIDGRRRPIPIEGSETQIKCDIVIPAIGQVASTESLSVVGGPELTEWGTVKVDPVEYSTTVDSIFAGGECVTGPASVIGAVAAGQKAAVSIDKKLGGSGNLPQDTGFSLTKPDEEALAQSPLRPAEKRIPLKERKRGFVEVVLGLDRSLALAEAGRCLRCDLEK
jgi:NADH-quinone oxidoreductase subunit F